MKVESKKGRKSGWDGEARKEESKGGEVERKREGLGQLERKEHGGESRKERDRDR